MSTKFLLALIKLLFWVWEFPFPIGIIFWKANFLDMKPAVIIAESFSALI